jgi:hypothetical protein
MSSCHCKCATHTLACNVLQDMYCKMYCKSSQACNTRTGMLWRQEMPDAQAVLVQDLHTSSSILAQQAHALDKGNQTAARCVKT